MRVFILLLCTLGLSACGMDGFGPRNEYGYIYYPDDQTVPDMVVQKVEVIRGREGSAVTREGRLDAILFDDMPYLGSPVGALKVRDDGEQLFIWRQRSTRSVQEQVRIFNVADNRLHFGLETREANRDAVLVCDLEAIHMSAIRDKISTLGLSPDVPFDVTFTPGTPFEFTPATMQPMGWTTSNAFVVNLLGVHSAEVTRGDSTIATVTVVQDGLYLSYNTESRVPTCATSATGIKSNRSPSAESFVLADPGAEPRIVIDRETLFQFPADSLDTATPFSIPSGLFTFVGPFR